jgi:putative transposase
MRKSRFTEAQIVGILRELDAGTTATELGRKHGIHANTIRLWKDRYGGLDSSDLVRLKQLEDENRRKDRIIARLSLEVDAMKELVKKTAGALAAARSGEGVKRPRGLDRSRLRVGRLQPQQSLLPPQPG